MHIVDALTNFDPHGTLGSVIPISFKATTESDVRGSTTSSLPQATGRREPSIVGTKCALKLLVRCKEALVHGREGAKD